MNINQLVPIAARPVAGKAQSAWLSHATMLLLLLTLFVGVVMQSARAQVAQAGVTIGNQASASYIDTANPGVPLASASNTVTTTVSQVYSFTLTAPGFQTRPLNQQVCYPHTITNTGNGNDSFALSAPVMGGTIIHVAPINYYLDADGNGVPDNGTAITTSTALTSAGPTSVFRFVVCANTPTTGTTGQTGTITVNANSAGSPGVTQSVVDTTTIGNCSITLTKALSSTPPPGSTPVSGGLSPNAGPLYVVLSYNNSGSIACNSVIINDPLPSGFIYVPGSGRWSNSGATVLGDGAGADPAGIVYTSPTTAVTGTVSGTIASVAGSTSGNLYFQVTVASSLAVGTASTSNTANVTFTDSVTAAVSGPNSSNTVTYSVAQVAAVAFNGSATLSGIANGDPVTVATAAAGQTITWTNYVWNNGNAPDNFDIQFLDGLGVVAGTGATFTGANCAFPGNAAPACTFPAGTTFTMYASNGVTTLLNNGGSAAPDTGTIPLPSAGTCAAPYVINAALDRCGYAVVVRATIPAGAGLPAGPHRIVLVATSASNNAITDTVTNMLTLIVANTVDLTNNVSVATAVVTDGLGAGTATVITTNTVTPAIAASTTSRFRLFVNNTSALPSIYDLSASFFSVPAGVGLAATPVNWAVQFKLDGGLGNCTTVSGGNITSTGAVPIAAGANLLICAEVVIPPTNQGGVGRPTDSPPGAYVITFRVEQQGTPAVFDTKRDQITLNNAYNVQITPNGAQNTSPGGSVTYTHTITNNGNTTDTISFPGAFLTNSQAPGQAWTASTYSDDGGNLAVPVVNGVLNIGTDTNIITTTTFTMAPNTTRTIFVRVNAPAMAGSPPNVTTLTATYNTVTPTTVSVTDTTTLTAGLRLDKFQQLTACGTAPVAPTITAGVPNGLWSGAAIAAGAGTAPGQCIAYLIVGTNTTSSNINTITVSDTTPANTRYHAACSPIGTAHATGPLFASSIPADMTSGTITAVSAATPAGPAAPAANLLPGSSVSLQFCVRIN